jgi:Lon protease-like protein
MSPLDADGNVLEFVKSIQAGQPERAFILACCSSELSAHLPLRFPLLSQHAAAAFIHLVASDAPAAAVLQQELPSEAELFATSVSKLKGIAALRYGFELCSLVLNVVCCTWFADDSFFLPFQIVLKRAQMYLRTPCCFHRRIHHLRCSNISTVGIVDKMDLVRAILDASLQVCIASFFLHSSSVLFLPRCCPSSSTPAPTAAHSFPSLQAASAPSHFLPTPLTLVTSILPCLPPPSELLSAISRAIAKVSSMSWPYGLLPPAPPLPDFSILSRDMSESLADALECSLCCDVLYRPCATSCGHCFCRQCLHRAMDHNLVCPLCRADVSQLIVLASRQFNSGNQAWGFPLTVDLAEIISRVFPEAAMMRAQEIETEASHDGLPLFVCNSCLPGQVVSLHIFEPRYRLMMRRALMLDRRFGMAAHTHQGPAQFGCVLRIDHAEMLPGGRMLIECMAEGVFQTTGLSVRDGYYVATVDMQHDAPTDYLNLARDEDASATLERNAAAAVQVLWNFVQFLQRHPDFGPVFVSTYGAYPEDVSQLAYKVALFMRFNDEEMQELLSCRHADLRALIVYTARERLFRSAMRQDVDNAERVRRRARMPSPSPPPDDRADDAQDE